MIGTLGRLPGHAAKRRTSAKRGSGRIAIRASSSEGPQGPIQIRAQVLRGKQASAEHCGTLGFVLPEGTPASADTSGLRWSEADLERAIATAKRAGLDAYRIEIAPDGTIAIVVGSSETADPA